MYDSVLVPTDGTPGAAAAIARALDLAATTGATVHALYVVDIRLEPGSLDAGDRETLRASLEAQGREATRQVREEATDLDVEVVEALREGGPHRAILEYAADEGIDLVVMGTHGRTGAERTHVGSTTERVIALGEVPVLAVRRAADARIPADYRGYDDVVVATDGSDAAERGADHGLAIAERYGADVHAVYVVDTSTFDFSDVPRSILGLLERGGENATEGIATAARERSLPVTSRVLRGVPDEELREYADGVGADLIVMGTRGRGGAPERLMGSVTARVVRRSSIPVLAVA